METRFDNISKGAHESITVFQSIAFSLQSSVFHFCIWKHSMKGSNSRPPVEFHGKISMLLLFSHPAVSDSLDPVAYSTPGLPIPHHLWKSSQVHVHCISDPIQPSHPLLPSSPSAPNLYQHQKIFQWVICAHQIIKILELQLQHQSFQWIFRVHLPRIDRFDLFAVQGIFRSLLQHHSSKASILWHSAIFTLQLSQPYMISGKTIALTKQIFVSRVMSLLFNTMSRFVFTFLPRSNNLISWLQSSSAVILEPKKEEIWYYFYLFPFYLPWSNGGGSHDLSFSNI